MTVLDRAAFLAVAFKGAKKNVLGNNSPLFIQGRAAKSRWHGFGLNFGRFLMAGGVFFFCFFVFYSR